MALSETKILICRLITGEDVINLQIKILVSLSAIIFLLDYNIS